ncbi:MAG: hypothetical protein WC831_02545 [Parcubacteria group bacterium]|jgi:hypothetical protein
MSEKPKVIVYLLNPPFSALVKRGKKWFPECLQAGVMETETSCGVGIVIEDGSKFVMGPTLPRNLIAGFRASLMISRLNRFEGADMWNAMDAGQRNNSPSSFAQAIIEKIGQKAYEEIMATPVPEEIIRAMLDNQNAEDPPDLWPITDEVRAGTIQWRQEFTDFGIPHPDEIDAKKRQREETLARFEPLIESYAEYRLRSRNCNVMDFVDGALISALDFLGNAEPYPDEVIVALAGYLGDLAFQDKGSMTLASTMSQDVKDRTERESHLTSALWLVANCLKPIEEKPWWIPNFFWTPIMTYRYSLDEAMRLLKDLTEEVIRNNKARQAEAA